MTNSPLVLVQVDFTDKIPLQTKLDQSVHLFKAVQTRDAVAISSKLP